jgi:hypothetical protein
LKTSSLRAVDAARKPMPGREPGLDDLLGYLRQRPALYEQVVESARIASAWASESDYGTRWSRRGGVHGRVLATVSLEGGLFVVDVLGTPQELTWLSRGAAASAADVVLRGEGWTLVDGVTP